MLNDLSVPGATKCALAVCADDFGLHAGVNQAVLELLALRRISAVSCLVDGPMWATGAEALKIAVSTGPGRERIADVGLHLNFTEMLNVQAQSGYPSRPLGQLILAAYARFLKTPALVMEIERQWLRFEAVWGRAPDFVDGHQHVHQLPQIREALMQVLKARYPVEDKGPRPWLRRCHGTGLRGLHAGLSLADTAKACTIGVLGAKALSQEAQALGLPCSRRLLGVYPFDADASSYMRRWRAWASMVRPGEPCEDLIMCHPSTLLKQQPAQPDPILLSRQMELAVLTSAPFADMLRVYGVRIARLSK